MAHTSQEICNLRTGQRMTFVELRPELLRIESVIPPTEEREPLHVHPEQRSGAELQSGSLVFEVDGVERRLTEGESISIPADTPHPKGLGADPDRRTGELIGTGVDHRDLLAFGVDHIGLGAHWARC